MSGKLVEQAKNILRAARRAGADGAEIVTQSGAETEVRVRVGKTERVSANRSKGVGLRVFVGRRTGFVHSTRVEDPKTFAKAAVELAKLSSPDPNAALPDTPKTAPSGRELRLYDPAVARQGVDDLLATAKQAEDATFAFDPRVTNSETAAVQTAVGDFVYANTRGFAGHYRSSSAAVYVMPVAEEGGKREVDYWFDHKRRMSQLQDPVEIGRKAAARVVTRLGSVKVPTTKVPVVFDQVQSSRVMMFLATATYGSSVYRKATFLADRLGETIASPLITIVDDGTMPGAVGSRPFDGEGVPTRRTPVIESGVLRSFLCDSYSARKLKTSSTGNAVRSFSSEPRVGVTNFHMLPGDIAPARIIADTSEGFYVTSMMGSGVNLVNGDFSMGAAGRWIRGGELAESVSEVTISGNLASMLPAVDAVGSDLDPRGSYAAPTFRISEMTVAGT
jgi:PmbA protein